MFELIQREFDKKHPTLTPLKFTGMAGKIQYMDSSIAEEIFRVFTNKKIVVLGIHDSFIV